MRTAETPGPLSSWFVVGCFLLATFAAGITVLWLIPGLVYVEALCWVILAIAAVWVLWRMRLLNALVASTASNWTVLPFLVWAGLSTFWSVFVGVSSARWVILLATVLIGAYVGLRYTPRQIVQLLAIASIVILLLSAVAVFAFPYLGVMNYYTIQGAWRGIYWHKNHMGMMAAFACILFLIESIGALQSRAKSAAWWALLYLLSLIFTYQTDSVGAYLTLIMVHGVVILSWTYLKIRPRLRTYHYAIVAGVVMLGLVVTFINLDHIFGVFGRNSSLTGRVPMWAGLFSTYLSQRPVAGYGFNAFWYIESHRITMQHLAGYPDPIVISDNGFIDILLNTGYIGLGLFLVFYLDLWRCSLLRAWRAANAFDVFPLALMTYTLLANMTWSVLFENESFFMLAMIAVMFSLCSRSGRPATPGSAQAQIAAP